MKGYVRCKTGDEDNTYHRKGSVISYAALEFYEQKRGGYFSLGVKIDSPDEEARLDVRWFIEECKLDELTFLTNGRPSMTAEFRTADGSVRFIPQINEAKARFARRLGGLEERFFDIIPKSLAFKPMDKVKDFINKFILSEKQIEVEALRRNIMHLDELKELMDITNAKISMLESVLAKFRDIEGKIRDIRINDVLIRKAEEARTLEEIESAGKSEYLLEQYLRDIVSRKADAEAGYDSGNKRLIALNVSLENNEVTRLISNTENEIASLRISKKHADEKYESLERMLAILGDALAALYADGLFIASKDEISGLKDPGIPIEDKNELVYKLQNFLSEMKLKYSEQKFRADQSVMELEDQRRILEREIRELKERRLIYPAATQKLKSAIEDEFSKRGIVSTVRIFSDLLEVTDNVWHNAVEGYLGDRRFALIVEPEFYRTARDVYMRMGKEVSSVDLVNTASPADTDKTSAVPLKESLVYVISSNNRHARAYAALLLGGVVRCDDRSMLGNYDAAITPDCILYEDGAIRKISEKHFLPPFIGENAYKKQLEMKEAEHSLNTSALDLQRTAADKAGAIVSVLDKCRMETIQENISVPFERAKLKADIAANQLRLDKARNDPNYIEIRSEMEQCSTSVRELKRLSEKLIAEEAGTIKDITMRESEIAGLRELLSVRQARLRQLISYDSEAADEGLKKFDEQIKTKTPSVIIANFSPYMQGLENSKEEMTDDLKELQRNFCGVYDCDLPLGTDGIEGYRNEHHKLVSSEIVKYEDELAQAKRDCEIEFKESFLARIKENIEQAKLEFRNLNRALKGIYYGEDSYRFDITFNKKKESLYRMVMSDQNQGGFSLWSSSFEAEFKEEMNDLFDKLTAYDDSGDNVISEYTDYRSYLDYDIIVEKRDGTTQRFSNIYGEKSGGETQTPYYVAIAASFVQLYEGRDSIRIIMLDEAFDKLDDNRIAAMMDFLNRHDFQIILATPPSKMEIIGEKVDTILVAIREGRSAYVEVYDL